MEILKVIHCLKMHFMLVDIFEVVHLSISFWPLLTFLCDQIFNTLEYKKPQKIAYNFNAKFSC
jgi:hypothetical protein